MRRQQADGFATRGVAAANACWGILDDDAVLGLDASLASALEVGVGAWERSVYEKIAKTLQIIRSTHAGFPCLTSSERMKTSGAGTPATTTAADEYLRVADVQIAHTGLGRCRPGAS